MQRSSAGVRTLLGVALAALIVGISTPAAAGTPTPSPSPSGGLPLGVTLGPIHVNLNLPLDLGALLGAAAPSSTPAPPTSAAASTPAPRIRTLHPSAPPVAASSPARPHPTTAAARPAPAPPSTATPRVTATVPRIAAVARHRVVAGPSLLQSAFEPGNPVMLLASVVLACALAVGTVVVMGGRRSPRTARHAR